MTDIITSYVLTDRFPHPRTQQLSYNRAEDLTVQKNTDLKDLFQRCLTHVRGADTTLVASDGSTPSEIALYAIDYTAGSILIAGLPGIFAAATTQKIIGSGAWDKSYQLDGSEAVVLTADGKTYDMVLVAIVVDGAVTLHAVFGDEAADGEEVALTMTTITAALIAADITDVETRAGVVVARMTFQRVATNAITVVNIDPAANLGLMAERSSGGVFGLEV